MKANDLDQANRVFTQETKPRAEQTVAMLDMLIKAIGEQSAVTRTTAAVHQATRQMPSGGKQVQAAGGAFVNWSDEMSVGVATMDSQHQRFFQLINQLYAAMKSGKGSGVLGTILAELAQYTEYHFSAEERLLEDITTRAYPSSGLPTPSSWNGSRHPAAVCQRAKIPGC